MKRLVARGVWVVCLLMLAGGCSLFRSKPLAQKRGAIALVFDSRTCGDIVGTSRKLAEQDVAATFFVSGQIDRGRAIQLMGILDDGHALGLSGLTGIDPKLAIAMFGAQKYFQDEIVTQYLGAKREGLEIRYFAYPPGRGTSESDAFLLKKGFRILVRTDASAAGQQLPDPSEPSSVITAVRLTKDNFNPAQLVDVSSRNQLYIVSPAPDVLPFLIEKARFRGIPFVTLDDL